MMAEERPHTPESTESLMRKLCFLMTENKQDVADGFYTTMRNLLISSRHNQPVPQPKSRSLLHPKSPTSPSASGFDETFHSDHQKVVQHLENADKNTAKEFSMLTERVLYDPELLLSDRTSSLLFLMKMSRKDSHRGDMIVDQTPILIPLEQNLTRSKLKESSSPGNSMVELHAVRRNHSSSTSMMNPSHVGNPTVQSSSSTAMNLSHVVNPPSRRTASAADSVTTNLNGRSGWVDSGISGMSLSAGSTLNASHRTHSKTQPASPVLVTSKDVTEYGVSEWDVIQAVVFTWQGIEGEMFKLDPLSQKFSVSDTVIMDKSMREKSESLAWLGYLYNTVHKFTVQSAQFGCDMVRRYLMAYLRSQLNQYNTLIASIRTQLSQEVAAERFEIPAFKSRVSLDRLRLLSLNPVRTFQNLIEILEFTLKDKGGYLASGVHSFLQHGDPDYQALVKNILSEICKPLYSMLTKWLLDGDICDEYKEFFIAADTGITGDRLWHEKYTLRMSMLPQFISVEQAEKILSVGKSINFLKEVCNDEEPLAGKNKIKEAFRNTDVEVLYLLSREDEMTHLIDLAYKQTNQRVMSVLIDKYSLLDHFQAHRKYLLLGQGDFIHYLMDLLSEVLDKPADQLAPHHLNRVLDNAVRSTSAQYELEDILNRLHAATLNHSSGDSGWDVFYLRYHVDGPIGTVFSTTKDIYKLLFYALWKAKHMEMVLSKLWTKLASAAKTYRKLEELKPVLRQCNELTAEMVHFIRQTQYYFLFEVLECSWNHLIAKVQQAECLDDVILSHQVFLKTVQGGVFKDHTSQTMSNQLTVLYNLILQLQGQVDILLRDLNDYNRSGHADVSPNSDSVEVETDRHRKDLLLKFLHNCKASVRLLGLTYRDTVKKLLLMLNSQNDLSLQLLSIRLDFSEHYNSLDSTLNVPLTFHHRRLSSTGSSGFSPLLPRKVLSTSKHRESMD